MNDEQFNIQLSRDEAIVLFDFLSRYSDSDQFLIEDQAEERVLWNMCCTLESGLSEPFLPDFKTRLDAARDNVRDKD